MYTLTDYQLAVVERPLTSHIFLRGPAGTGKSTAGAERLKHLLSNGVAGSSVLVLGSHRILQDPYLDIAGPPSSEADAAPTTIAGLASRLCNLFWPLAAQAAGFAHPEHPPVLLNHETAQYYMAHVVGPLLDSGSFESVTLDRPRLYTQILDNLNRSATVGFPYTEIGARLDAAWSGDPAYSRVYADVQDAATRFREFCLQNNLLDFSLLLEVFATCLWPDASVRDHLSSTYRHLIYDNVEEDVPRNHDVVRAWLPEFESALLVFDVGGGYRSFLGADAETGAALGELCDEHYSFDESFVMSPAISDLENSLRAARTDLPDSQLPIPEAALPLDLILTRFIPEMMDAVTAHASSLITEQGVPPSEIVILAPVLPEFHAVCDYEPPRGRIYSLENAPAFSVSPG